MTREEIAAAYRFAGVPDPERMAGAAELALCRGGVTVPSCPSCQAGPEEVAWLGALPGGSGHWRCTRCGHAWATPPAAAPVTGLTGKQLVTLELALGDAVDYRARYGACKDCDDQPGGLCGDHYDDDARVSSYLALAGVLGIEVPR